MPKVTDEQVSQYFFVQDPFQTVPLPIASHLEKVEATLTGEIPTKKDHVVELRTSLFKLAHSVSCLNRSRLLLSRYPFNSMTSFCLYAKAKDGYNNAQHSLNRLRDLQAQKHGYTKTFLDSAARKMTLA